MVRSSSSALAVLIVLTSIPLLGFTGAVRPSNIEKIDPSNAIHPDFHRSETAIHPTSFATSFSARRRMAGSISPPSTPSAGVTTVCPTTRAPCSLGGSFADISSDPVVQSLLAAQYGDIHEIDLWVGGISEDPVNGGHVGELFFNILKSQFEALRDGDRYWYEIALPIDEVIEIENTTLADVIRRNTAIDTEIDDDVFHVN